MSQQHFREAERRVEAARLDHSDTLDLSGLRLRSVPDGVAELTWLRELKLNDNWLSELPGSLGRLTELNLLDLKDNWLGEVPAWITGLSGLTYLDLGDNQILEVPGWIGGLTQLAHLGLCRCDLDAVPDWIPGLLELTELDLSYNFLTEIPDSLGALTGLAVLNLGRNQLSSLPPSLANLTRLTELEVGQNRLAELPDWIGRLTELTKLGVDGVPSTALPSWIGDLTALTYLDLAHGRLPEVPPWLSRLTDLTWLDLGANWLTELPDWLGDLTALTSLRLSDNSLHTLPETLSNLTSLTELYVQENQLTELPAWISQLTSLTRLDFQGNQIHQFPEWIGDLTELTQLSLIGSQLETIPDWVANLTALADLNLSLNHLTEIPVWMGDLTHLTSLQLGSNRLRELPETLSNLTNLTALSVSGNQLTELPDWIGQLTDLSALNLSVNRFRELPSTMSRLANLRQLILSGYRPAALPAWISDLTELTQLYLADCDLTELPRLTRNLPRLEVLSLGNNHLETLPDWIGTLPRIRSLYLNRNQFREIPRAVKQLDRIQDLRISENALTELPEWIDSLSRLRFLWADKNQLSELPATLGSASGLSWLTLTGNQFTVLPDQLADIATLTHLDFAENQLDGLPDWIGDLTHLDFLDLRKCGLTKAPRRLGDLTSLTWLDISSNTISFIPGSLARLTGLKNLYCDQTGISSLPGWIGNLNRLTLLNVSSNELTALPESLRKLTSLSKLHLQSNQLAEAPDWLLDLPSLEKLSLADNPTLISPPPEIAASGTDTVLAFLRARREGATRQWISKLLVVGEGGVGKTSLIKALTDAEHDPAEETTHGIRVDDLFLQHPDETNVQMRLSTWDFGGQQIYHATHQFFMTDRSLFLLLWNARLGWEQGRLHYWLDIIKSRAPESPVLIIATHADASQRPVDLPTDDLRREYPQIVDCLIVDNETRRGLEEVRGQLARRAADLPLMGTEWPTTWLNAADAVRAHPENHITPEYMWQLMAEAGVTDAEQQQYIAVAMHQLGDILYYHDDPELAQTVVLQPEWVNEYISKVLDSAEVDKAQGLLTHAEMTRLWARLDRGMRDHFLGMMDKYEISFRIADEPTGVVSLVVERLPWNPPPYEEEWSAALDAPGTSEIRVIYQLNTIPPGIPTWFIARSHRFTTKTHWRTGAVLAYQDGKHKALLRATPQRKTVELTVRGPAPSYFFSVLDDGFNRTLERYPGLEIRRLVPCPCEEDGTCTETFEYNDLQRRLQRKPPRHEIECRKSGEDVHVPQLLLGLAPSERDSTQVAIERLTAMFNGVVDKVDTVADLQEQKADQQEYLQWTLLKLLQVVQGQQEVTCPSVFSLTPVKQRATGNRLELRLYCEEPGAWHPLPGEAGRYELNEPAEWLQKIKPHLSQLLAVLKHAAPLAGPVLGMTVAHVSDQVKSEIEAMAEIVSQIPEPSSLTGPLGKNTGYRAPGPMSRASNEADFRALEGLLRRLDPDRAWGGLSRTVTPEGLTLYLCREHAEVYRRAVRL